MSSSRQPPSPTPSQISKRIARVRDALHRSAWTPIVSQQETNAKDLLTKGNVWVSRVTYPSPPEDALQKLLSESIRELGNNTETLPIPEIGHLEAQWVGWRSGVGREEPEPSESPQQTYNRMMEGVESDLVVLFGYAGAFMLGGPASARPLATQIARLTKARCYIPRYRLAPQNPFPAAILDLLHAYLTLISPPPGSLHAPVAPSSIVFAGESSGACIVLAVVQILLSFARRNPDQQLIIQFHGQSLRPQLPAGVAVVSLAADNVLALPSWYTNAESDIFANELPAITRGFPSDSSWPSNPPREHVYARASMLTHPLSSLCTTPAHFWKGAPPLWISMGSGERLLDGAKIVARDFLSESGKVQWVEVEQMPHLFTAYQDWWQAKKVLQLWAAACDTMAKGGKYESGGTLLRVDQSEQVIDLGTLTVLRHEDILLALKNKAKGMKIWTGEDGPREKEKL